MAQGHTQPEQCRVLLATGNPAKQATLGWLLEGLPVRTVTPADLGIETVPEETADTHLEIAQQKALAWSEAASMRVIASDGGLDIPALGSNWQSRYTHRFAGGTADDTQRVNALLELMRPYQGQERAASWIEAVAIADRGKVLASWELTGATGLIGDQPGEDGPIPGFWVFSVWRIPYLDKYYNQLTETERESLDDHWVRLKALVRKFFLDQVPGAKS